MSDRRELQAQKSKLAEMYQTQRVKMENSGASVDQLSRLKKMFNDKVSSLEQQYGDTLSKLNRGENVKVAGGTSSGMELNQSKLPDMAKKVGLGKESLLKRLGKGKGALIAGVLGAGASALLPENSYAADVAERIGKAAEEIDPMVQAQKVYEGIRTPDEIQKEAEMEARRRYEKSPAFSNLRNRLQKKMGQ